MWQLDVSDAPDVDVLRSGAAAVFLTQPALARRLAERALPHDPTPLSALLLADAHAELGQVDAARDAQALATERISSDDDRLHVRLNQVSLIAFSDRRPIWPWTPSPPRAPSSPTATRRRSNRWRPR
jgi:hypothetical protein